MKVKKHAHFGAQLELLSTIWFWVLLKVLLKSLEFNGVGYKAKVSGDDT